VSPLLLFQLRYGRVTDVRAALEYLRDQRGSLVQTADQLRFCVESVVAYLEQSNREVTSL
jgi:protein tyrosine phosphatase